MRPGLIAALVLFLIPQPAYRSASVGPGGSDPLPRLDEYEDLLRQSIDVWRDFRGRFKDLANLSVSQDNGETVLTGSVEAYKVKNSTFEARFAGPTQINSLAIILDPSNARDRRLRSDLSNRIAKGQPKLEDWLPSEIRDIRDNLLVERIEVRFGPGQPPHGSHAVLPHPDRVSAAAGLSGPDQRARVHLHRHRSREPGSRGPRRDDGRGHHVW